MNPSFRPIRGTEEKLLSTPYQEGYIYFAVDTGNIYMDANGQAKIPLGGRGAAVLYSKVKGAQNAGDDNYTLYQDGLEDPNQTVREGDLIINTADGAFYKVLELNPAEEAIICARIAVSGSGGGGGTGGVSGPTIRRGRLTVTNDGESDILNGSPCTFTITTTSATETIEGQAKPIDDELQLAIKFMLTESNQVFYTETLTVEHGQTFTYNVGEHLRSSSDITIDFKLSGSLTNSFYNSGQLQRRIKTHDLNIEWVASQFSNMKYFTDSINTSIRFSTGARRILDVYFDDALIYTKIYSAEASDANASPIITKNSTIYNLNGTSTGNTLSAAYSHGRHTISARLSLAKADGSRGSSTNLIKKEVALYLDEGYPLIWFGDMESIYYEYDTPLVPIRVYDPHAGAAGAEVYLYIDGSDALDGSCYTISNDASNYLYWTLTKLAAGQTTVYQVRVGEDKYETWETVPEFEVLEDPRKMDIARSSLIVDFDSRGRSNSEVAQRRSQLKIGDSYATLSGFNWYNNGWVMDSNNVTCLRISNGASVSLPIGSMSFAGNIASHTIEMRLKIRNVQSYDKLITNYTRYQVISDPDKLSSPDIDRSWTDDTVFAEFLAQKATGLASYDAYLTKRLPELREQNPTIPTYEDLEFSRLHRTYDLASAMVKYIENESSPQTEAAICLGPQDGYFSNGTNAVTVDYVEDKVINLTIVYDNGTGTSNLGNNKLMKFYLNGMLTSVARSQSAGSWSIGANNLIISSGGCDVDLYKFRVYNRALGLNEVLKNIAYDDTDTTAWDLAELYVANESIGEDYQFSYNKMIEYNKNHPDGYIMPYIIFTTDDTDNSTGGKLPWRKDTPVTAGIEFVNTGLERAYDNGDLAAEAKAAGVEIEDYYLHHCPSWIAEGAKLSVQGTSSEFYPRRNYKGKTKVDVPHVDENGGTSTDEFGDVRTDTVYTMKCHKGPFKKKYDAGEAKPQKFFYYDNNTVGTNKFTLKVDYMESSGTYNMGLANLVNTAYSHHPLRDYNSAEAFVTGTAGKETLISAYPANGLCWYRNHKGNWKCASTGDASKDEQLITTPYGDVLGDISCKNAADFAKGPWQLAKEQGQTKVLGGTKKTLPDSLDDIDIITNNINQNSENGTYDDLKGYINKWYSYVPGTLSPITVGNLSDYRTSVQGFPTLAFWQTKTGKENKQEPLFIGRYNMLLDKGSAEAYGFKLGGNYKQAFIEGNPSVADVAECWEFENNSRGYCSFRDPWSRKELSFKAPVGESNEFTAKGAPIIADYFEYRYNANDDYIDMLYSMNASFENTNTIKKLQKQFGADQITDIASGRKKLLDLYSNWEKAVAWVWSTATDAVIDGKTIPTLGSYNKIELAEYIFAPNKFYIEDEQGGYKFATEYKTGISYYLINNDKQYYGVTVTNEANKVYVANKYYTLENDSYVLAEGAYDSSEVYYELVQDTSKIDEFWKLPAPVTYGTTTYEYDTQEYRLAKFKNEIEDHFNLEYLVTYFVITEVLECYDSRGKNAMFASWGPQKAKGDYIWYPIFYDMDTQLGINNTGIPSFEYNIDATEDGTFSTNDSVLWNNLYALFKNLITDKYEQLTGVPSDYFGGKLENPPFVNVETIQSWYTCDPKYIKSYSVKGIRPLLALNLDEQYKYISITNGKVGYQYQNGEITQDTSNTYFYALQGDRKLSNNQFLTNRLNYIDSWLAVGNYKRGGANRIRSRVSANNAQNTSDKWIEGTSTNGASGLIINTPYYKEDGKTKTHLFDGEYWITMTPVRNMYVTVGTDAANFPSLKYSGTPVRFETSDLEKGVRESGNYREQLYYIYGLDQMKSLGDLSRLYFQEFELSGKASKMVDLLLGYDGTDEEGSQYKNNGVNDWTIPAAAGTITGGMPLLREVNLSNITFKNQTPTFDFSSCEKLENFRDIGSNITQVTFADGVALNTLYLSDSTVNLKLVEARLLTDLVTDEKAPITRKKDNTLTAKPGLFIDGLTNNKQQTKLITFDIQGGNLGYNSYKLLKLYIDAASHTDANATRNINLTDVQWSPYVKVTDSDLGFSNTAKYFKDDGHFGLVAFTRDNYNEVGFSGWSQLIKNEMIYEYTPTAINGITLDEANGVTNITDTALLEELVSNVHYLSTAESNNEVPNITGYVYINNETAIDEGTIQTKLASKFPGLTFFFNKVDKGYAARFVILENGVETLIGTDKISKQNFNTFFTNPLERTETAFSPSRINALRPTKDFLGWGTTNNRGGLIETYDEVATGLGLSATHLWKDQKLEKDKYDYTFYAVFEDHCWNISFYIVEADGSYTPITKDTYSSSGGEDVVTKVPVSYKAVHGSILHDPGVNVARSDEVNLAKDQRYRFIGFTRKVNGKNVYSAENAVNVVDFSKIVATANTSFYAAFVEESVYNKTTDDKYFDYVNIQMDGASGYRLELKSKYCNSGFGGKITLPVEYNEKPILQISGFGGETNHTNITHVFFKGTPKVKSIAADCFRNCDRLKYFQYPDTITELEAYCFQLTKSLEAFRLNKGLKIIGDSALNQAFEESSDPYELYIPGTVSQLDQYGVSYLFSNITSITIGGPGDGTNLRTLSPNALSQNHKASSMTVYSNGPLESSFKTLLEATSTDSQVGFIKPNVTINYVNA